MKPIHSQAMNIAATYFLLCACLAVFLWFTAFGTALSDSYQPAPLWFTLLTGVLIVLQAPVAGVAWLWHRSSPSGHMNILLMALLAGGWSLLLGYGVCFIKSRYKR